MPDVYNMSDVFISYSRKDSIFVKKLFKDIKDTGKEVWADFEDIPKAADWWAEIQAGIDAAEAFIFVISPDSVISDICRQEIDHALAMNKRFLPILYREVTEDAHKAKIHPAVSSHNWIFFREYDNYQDSFKELMESVETDLEHNRTLTRLLVRAKEWQDNDKKNSYLLQGEDLDHASTWLAGSINKVPSPTDLHAEYIRTSDKAEASRQRRLLFIVSAGMVVSLLLAVFAAFQTYQAYQAREQAEVAREQAETAKEQAEENERLARSLALSASANQALANNNPDLALILAENAVGIDDSQQAVTTSLADAAYTPATRARIETADIANTVVYAQDGTIFAAGFFDGNICLYEGSTGTEIACLTQTDAAAHNAGVLWIHMDTMGTRLLSSGEDNRLVLWNIDQASPDFGTIINEIEVNGLNASSLASNGSFALFGVNSGLLGYWDLSDAEAQYFDAVFRAPITVIAINGDDTLALTGSDRGLMKIWDIETLSEKEDFFNPDNTAEIVAVTFSPDDSIVVAGDYNAGISAWNVEFGSLIRTYQGHDEAVTGITFSETGRTMFTSSWDNSIIEWDIDSGRRVRSFYGHNGGINGLSLTGDNRNMVSGGFDSTLRIWHVRPIIQERQILTNDEQVMATDWDNSHIVTAQDNGDVMVFDTRTSEPLHHFEHPVAAVSVDLHPDHTNFVVVYDDCQLGYYTVSGETHWKIQLEPTEDCAEIHFRPNSEDMLVVSRSALILVDADGESRTIPYNPEHSPRLISAEFTQDGQQLLIGENRREDMLRRIDVETGETLMIYEGHNDGVLGIKLSPDGTQFLSGGFDNGLRLWDIEHEHSLLLMEGHSDRIMSVDFHPNGVNAISASNDRTMRLWDLNTGFTRYTYRGHTERIVEAKFSEDGRRMLTASYDSTLVVWKFPQQLDELRQWIGENRYIRDLTCGEQHLYIDQSIECDTD